MSRDERPASPRKPVVFNLEEETPSKPETISPRKPAHFDDGVSHTGDEDDPFLSSSYAEEEGLDAVDIPAQPRRFPFFKIALSAFGAIASLGIGLWTDRLIEDLFVRADWLGYLAIAIAAIAVISGLAFIVRELSGLASLTNIQKLKQKSRAAALSRDGKEARQVITALTSHLSHRPETAKGRSDLAVHMEDIIDNPGLVALAETELLTPLDREARALIAGAARRVSVVTAVSPRALVDIGYVLFEAARLIRTLAVLYGGRPGFFGLIRLLRETVAHLAVTGTIALGDDIIQQLLGHGLASKVSAKLGEGIANGLMTARIGIAAMDLCRPMDFSELRRPKVTDFLNVLTNKSKKQN